MKRMPNMLKPNATIADVVAAANNKVHALRDDFLRFSDWACDRARTWGERDAAKRQADAAFRALEEWRAVARALQADADRA